MFTRQKNRGHLFFLRVKYIKGRLKKPRPKSIFMQENSCRNTVVFGFKGYTTLSHKPQLNERKERGKIIICGIFSQETFVSIKLNLLYVFKKSQSYQPSFKELFIFFQTFFKVGIFYQFSKSAFQEIFVFIRKVCVMHKSLVITFESYKL